VEAFGLSAERKNNKLHVINVMGRLSPTSAPMHSF
jgi:hypothetical protein